MARTKDGRSVAPKIPMNYKIEDSEVMTTAIPSNDDDGIGDRSPSNAVCASESTALPGYKRRGLRAR